MKLSKSKINDLEKYFKNKPVIRAFLFDSYAELRLINQTFRGNILIRVSKEGEGSDGLLDENQYVSGE